ncbi:MAG: adenylosuccinate lyase [Chloroflexi bacterium]|nr:adenylosuccinate lyase [Chloroflexota bacterium]
MFETYQSPFTWRYGSDEMRQLWSEVEKRRRMRKLWVALAEAQQVAGLVTEEQVADLKAHVDDIDIERSHEIEVEIRHDVMAEVRAYAEQCKVGGGIIHLGATSMDITDNVAVWRQLDALTLILGKLSELLELFTERIEAWADVVTIGWTHLQPAEPTTVGYRLALYAQDLLADERDLRRIQRTMRAKGIKGAVGTAASYHELLIGTGLTPTDLELRVMSAVGLDTFPVTNQTYPRRQDRVLLDALAGLAGTLYRFAFDLRVLQSPAYGEWSEPFGKKQVGSSAMPFKRNPINSEKLNSLGRYVASLPNVMWHNAAHSLLERTLDDSANRRSVTPEAFLALDEMLRVSLRVLRGLEIDERRITENMARYGVFAATERVLMALGRSGADRQNFHEIIRDHSMTAWTAVQSGQANPLIDLLAADEQIKTWLDEDEVRDLMDASTYVGHAPARARQLAALIITRRVSPLA